MDSIVYNPKKFGSLHQKKFFNYHKGAGYLFDESIFEKNAYDLN